MKQTSMYLDKSTSLRHCEQFEPVTISVAVAVLVVEAAEFEFVLCVKREVGIHGNVFAEK